MLLDEEGNIALTDFGLAKIIQKNQMATSFVGTPEYLAPEVLEADGYDGRMADLWSLGTIMFFFLKIYFSSYLYHIKYNKDLK